MSQVDGRGHLAILGGFRLLDPNGYPIPVQRQRIRDLLTCLALAPKQRLPRSQLVELLWPHLEPARARHNLRQTVLTASRTLASTDLSVLISDSEQVGLPSDLDSDVALFYENAKDPGRLEAAATLYAGELRADADVGEDPFGEWLAEARRELELKAIDVFTELLSQQTPNQPERAVDTARRLLDLDPFREDAHRALIKLYVRLDRKASALNQFHVCRDLLKRELDVEPEAATVSLYNQIAHEPIDQEDGESVGAEARESESDVVGDAPFGREEYATAIRRCLISLRKGTGGVVIFRGGRGLGKTRLLQHLAELAHKEEIHCVAGRGLGARLGRPYATLEHLGDVDVDPAELDGDTRDLEPGSRSQGVALRYFQGRLQELAGECSIALFVDDLQEADGESVDVLLDLATQRRPPVLLVAAWDPEGVESEWLAERMESESSVNQFVLRPLNRQETSDLAMSLAPQGRARIRNKTGRIFQVTGGIPAAVHEAVAVHLDGPVDRVVELPPIIKQKIRQRLRDVEPGAKHLARIGAVMGAAPDWDIAVKAADVEQGAEALESLSHARILTQIGGRFRFAETWIQIGLYEQLSPPALKAAHRAIANTMEVAKAENGLAWNKELAGHYYAAGDTAEAVQCSVLAAENELDRGNYGQTSRLAGQAIAWADKHGDERAILAPRIRAELLKTQLAISADEMAEARTRLDAAIGRASEAGLNKELGCAYRIKANLAGIGHDVTSSIRYLAAAATAFEAAFKAGEVSSPQGVWDPLDLWLADLGQLDDPYALAAVLKYKLAQVQHQGLRRSEVHVRLKLALCHFTTGASARAEEELSEALQVAERVGFSSIVCLILGLQALVASLSGNPDGAAATIAEAHRLARSTGDILRDRMLDMVEGVTLIYGHREMDAVTPLRRALEGYEEAQAELYKPLCRAWLAEAQVGSAAAEEEGVASAEEALGEATRSNSGWARALAERAMGKATLATPGADLPSAEKLLSEAVLAQDAGHQHLEGALSRLVLARVQRRRGSAAAAVRTFNAAAGVFERSGLTHLQDTARRQAEALESAAE